MSGEGSTTPLNSAGTYEPLVSMFRVYTHAASLNGESEFW